MARLGRGYTIPVITRTPAPDAPVVTSGGRSPLIISAPAPPSRGVAVVSSAPALGNPGQETVVTPPVFAPRVQAPIVAWAAPDTPIIGDRLVGPLIVASVPARAAICWPLVTQARVAQDTSSTPALAPTINSGPWPPSRGLAVLSSAPATINSSGQETVVTPLSPVLSARPAIVLQNPLAVPVLGVTPVPLITGIPAPWQPRPLMHAQAASADVPLGSETVITPVPPPRRDQPPYVTMTAQSVTPDATGAIPLVLRAIPPRQEVARVVQWQAQQIAVASIASVSPRITVALRRRRLAPRIIVVAGAIVSTGSGGLTPLVDLPTTEGLENRVTALGLENRATAVGLQVRATTVGLEDRETTVGVDG